MGLHQTHVFPIDSFQIIYGVKILIIFITIINMNLTYSDVRPSLSPNCVHCRCCRGSYHSGWRCIRVRIMNMMVNMIVIMLLTSVYHDHDVADDNECMVKMTKMTMMMLMLSMFLSSYLPILPLEEESLSFLLFPDNETPLFLSSSSFSFEEELLSTSFLLLLSRGSGFALTGGFGSQAARRSRT